MTRLLVITVCVTLSLIGGQASFAQQEVPVPAPKELTPQTSPVRIDDTVLFSVRGIKAYPSEVRATAIAERIKKLAEDRSLPTDSITAVQSETTTDIVAGGRPIMSILDADAALEGISRKELAKVYVIKIRSGIEKYRRHHSTQSLLTGALRAFLATLILIAALLLIGKLFRAVNTSIEKRYKARLQWLQAKSFEIIHAEEVWAVLKGCLRVVRVLLVLAILYSYLALVLSFFPWTRLRATNLLGYVLTPVQTIGKAVIGYVPNLIFIFILVVITRYGLKLMRLFFVGIEKRTISISGFDPDWANPTYKIVRLFAIALAAAVAYPYIPGSESPAFKGISIFIGVIFSLGSSSAISNIIAGYTMTYRRAFKVGDRVKIGDLTGDVTLMRLLVTHLKTIKNEEIIVPNSLILNSHVINYSSLAREQGLILHTTVTIGYDAPWRQVHAMLLMAADKTPGLLREPPPFILQRSLDDFYVTYELNAYTDTPQAMAHIYSDLHQNIQDAFNEYGVQIMSPAYESDPDRAKFVPKERWYAAPAKLPEDVGSGER
jgi:small-conductance mechanosensitive channel